MLRQVRLTELPAVRLALASKCFTVRAGAVPSARSGCDACERRIHPTALLITAPRAVKGVCSMQTICKPTAGEERDVVCRILRTSCFAEECGARCGDDAD